MKSSAFPSISLRLIIFICGLAAVFVPLTRNSNARLNEGEMTLSRVQANGPVVTFAAAPLPLLPPLTCTLQTGLIISEFRFRGNAGPNDEFIELYNSTDTAITVCTTDGSAGWAVAARNAAATSASTLFVVPNGTVIPARGHYLGVNNSVNGYSLGSYASGVGTTATGDTTYPVGADDNSGVALFNTANSANFSTSTRLDAVGFSGPTGAIADLYREGTGYPPIGINNGQYTLMRRLANGLSADANDNATDIWFISTTAGTFGGSIGSALGAPGPENLGSPVIRNSTLPLIVLDSTVAGSVAPNRIRDLTSDPANNSTFGTMLLRRRIINSTGAPLTRLRLQVASITTYPPPNGTTADLRVRSVGASTVSNVNDAATCAASGTPSTPPCTVTVQGTTLEEPPTQSMGGGYNSTVSVALPQSLAAGASVNIQLLVGLQQTGGFVYLLNSMGLTASSPPAAPSSLTATAVSSSQINLAWTDNSGDETGFKIERKTGAGGTYSEITTVGANVTSYNNTGLSSNTQYYYRVRATNGSGNSAYTSEANATTANVAPSVSLTAPANGSTYTAPATVSLTATASDTDGTITKVEFFQGAIKLGEDTNGADGYSFNWTNVGAASYSLTAKATDNSTAVTTSTASNITVSLPVVTVTATDASASEPGSNTGTFTVSRTGTTGSVLVVNFSVGGTATAASDYTALGTSLTIPSGASSQTITVTPIDNAAVESTETVTLTLSTNAAYTVGSPANASLNITDNDTHPPTVSITSPTSGTVVTAPGSLTINASASDQDGTVSKVEFFRNGTKIGEDTSSPYSFAWSNVAAGNYSLTAVATDNANATGTSAAVSVVVNSPPAVSITSPANNATFTGSTVTINASAADSDAGVSKVEFFKGGTEIGEDTSSPYSFQWANAPEGSHSLTAVATDTYGATSTSAAVQISVINFNTARLDPANRVGNEDPLSGNFSWSLSLLNLPGRAGLDLSLSLNYNSLVWTRSGSYISFNQDHGFPSPGFRLGFPVIQPSYYNPEVQKTAFLLISPDGSRTELRQVGSSTLYESADSSYLLLDSSTMKLRTNDGTQLSYVLHGDDFQCTQIKDRNGNFITINYTPLGRIDTIVDTAARTIDFNYDSNNNLIEIKQTWTIGGQAQTHYWARFEYSDLPIDTNFNGLTHVGLQDGETINVLTRVTLTDDSRFDFNYTSWGQVWKITNVAADAHTVNYRAYDLPLNASTVQTDCPRITARRDWAENWNRSGPLGPAGLPIGAEQEAVRSFTVSPNSSWTLPGGTQQTGTMAQVSMPGGTYHRIYFPAAAPGAWHRGLPSLVETYDSTGVQRRAVTTWTQDDTSVSYLLNPRIIETNVYDPANNRARTAITYQSITLPDDTTCKLPQDIREYQADAATVLRRTHTEYDLTETYTSRRIIGLLSERTVYEGESALISKVSYVYDESTSIQGNEPIAQHDNANYPAGFIAGRGNLSSIQRHDVTNTSSPITTSWKYNKAGARVVSIDPLSRQVTVSYVDSFSDGINRNTFAYPKTISDATGVLSTAQYNFDHGALTRVQGATPAGQTTGAIKHYVYDTHGRTERVATEVNGNANYSYTRFVYSTSQNRVDTYETIQQGQGESHAFQIADGHGRLFATASDHPGSDGGYSGQLTLFDVMGRALKSSNPTETAATATSGSPLDWTATGDDSAWVYKQQTYDWKGRPLVTTNADGTTKTAAYDGCGCAGGEVVTLTDEGTIDGGVFKRRQQKFYSDILGRTVKSERYNWQGGTVYSTTVTTYNALDQVTNIKHHQGDTSAAFQETIRTYDGYGRLSTSKEPTQIRPMSFIYNADDTLWKVITPREPNGGSPEDVTATFTYNNRRLLTRLEYSVPAGLSNPALSGFVAPRATVEFTYDPVGNRLSMTDGLGRVDYTYDSLSRLITESRTYTDPANTSINGVVKTLTYGYNAGSELTHIIDPTGVRIDYPQDRAGRLTGVSGSGVLYGGISNYISGIEYRAWGAIKGWNYGNTRTMVQQFNSRLQLTRFEVPGITGSEYEYSTPGSTDNDGKVKFIRDVMSTNSKFDRLYKYDHAGRLSQAITGPAARGEADVSNRPFHYTYTFDQWDNLTNRTGKLWSQNSNFNRPVDPVTNRTQGWVYDANGFATTQSGVAHRYDAAGQVIRNIDSHARGEFTSGLTLEQGYDGDGIQIKTIENGTIRYFVRSSVIDGEIITEINNTGQYLRGYVYANGSVLAKLETNAVQWYHHNPITRNTNRTALSGGTTALRTELDPFGVEAGQFDWSILGNRPGSDTSVKSTRYTDPYRLDLSCTIDYVIADCQTVSRLTRAGALAVEFRDIMKRDNDGNAVPHRERIIDYGLGLYGVYLPDGSRGNDLTFDLHFFTLGVANADPNCFLNAVPGSPGLARHFRDGHDGYHARGPGNVIALPAMVDGVVKKTGLGDTSKASFNNYVDIALKGGQYVAILKDVGNVQVNKGDVIRQSGQQIGKVNGGNANGYDMLKGLHFSLIRAEFYDEYRSLTPHTVSTTDPKYKQANETINKNREKWFVDPLSEESPFKCPGIKTRLDIPMGKDGKPTVHPVP